MIELIIAYLYVIIDELWRLPTRILFHLLMYNQDAVNLYCEVNEMSILPEEDPVYEEWLEGISDWSTTRHLQGLLILIYSIVSFIWNIPTSILFTLVMRTNQIKTYYVLIYMKYADLFKIGDDLRDKTQK
jgi:hypothetical protein